MSKSREGIVLTRTRIGVLVTSAVGEPHVVCRVRGKGKKIGMPVPGDTVRYTPPTSTSDGWVTEILERRSLYQRYSFGAIKEIAANMDQLVLMVTPDSPPVSPRLLDRMLVGASVGNMEPLILLNKSDLFTREQMEEYLAPAQTARYKSIIVSSETGESVREAETFLKGKTSLLVGPSGVGKSTLLNRLIKDLELDTSALSDASGRGVHTTTFTRLFPLPNGGIIADSPGVREFFPVVEADELHLHFPEFTQYRDDCDYEDCLHLKEEGCAVKNAVENGGIHPDRYQSYQLLYESILQGPKRGRQSRNVQKL